MTELVISCIPVYNAKNVAYARRLMRTPGPVPWLKPYDGSIRDTCDSCDGDVWVGPEQAKVLKFLTALGAPPPVVCHFCAIASGQYDGTNLHGVSHKETGQFDG